MAKHTSRFIVKGLLVLLSALAVPAARAQGHQIAVLVEEGRHSLNGHVFVSLSDGVKTFYYGFYSKSKALAPAALGGGEIRDDSTTDWDVKRVYNIDLKAYQNAFEAIIAWKNSDKAWWFDHHCGDFAETVLESASVSLPLNWSYSGRNRPGIFGQYIREHGGIAHYPFEGDWIVESSDFIPVGVRLAIEHWGDGYLLENLVYRGTDTNIQFTHVLNFEELRQRFPQVDISILTQAQGGMSSRAELTLSNNGQQIDLLETGDFLRYTKVVDGKTGTVVGYRFDGIEKGGAIPMHAILRRAMPEGEEN